MLKKYQNISLVILSGIATGLSIYYVSFWLIWVALVPFLSVITGQSRKKSFLFGLLFGVTEGSILFFWIIEGTQRYSGSTTLLGIPIFLFLVFFVALFPAAFALVVSILTTVRAKQSVVFTAVVSAFVWVIFEWININILSGVPWIKYSLGFTQAENLYGLQLVSVTGQWGISFIIVLVSCYLASALREKNVKTAYFAFAGVFLFYFTGFMIFSVTENKTNKQISVAILQENIKAETRWQESNGDKLAGIFFDLNQQAANLNPDIIVWSETALPWTFINDDPLLTKALNITKKVKAAHIVGMLRQAEKTGRVFNSAFYIEPGGSVSGIYDKVDLLSFIEEPLISSSLKIPFLSDGLYTNIIPGKRNDPIDSPYGKIGVLICNESLLPYPAKKLVKNGAEFLVNLSNDGWLEGTQLAGHHFYYSRMRAVETGRDVVINSNRGFSGIVSGNGVIIEKNISGKAVCTGGVVKIRQTKTIYLQFGGWFVYIGIIYIFIYLYIFIQRGKNNE